VADDSDTAAGAEGSVRDDQEAVAATLYGAPVTWMRGQQVLHPSRDQAISCLQEALDDGFLMCVDLTAVDYLTFGERSTAAGGDRPVARADQISPTVRAANRGLPPGVAADRFEVVINLLRLSDGRRIRFRVQVPEDDPTFPSITGLWFGADAMEREAYDMFGIEFTDHPDLSRILMPEDWVGHPLRKDYNSGRIPVQFKGDPAGKSR